MFLPSIFTRLQKKDDQEKTIVPAASPEGETVKYPEIIPILPLRGVVVYPQTAVPLTIGQPRSIKLVDEVSGTTEKLIGLVAARNPEIEEPGPGGPVSHRHDRHRPPAVPRPG